MSHLTDELQSILPGVTVIHSSSSTPQDPIPGETRLIVHERELLLELLRALGGLGLARAWVKGYVTIDGDHHRIFAAEPDLHLPSIAKAMIRDLPLELTHSRGGDWRRTGGTAYEYRPRGRRTRFARVRAASDHHYGIGNQFYARLLGESLTYSCAIPATPSATLLEAQNNKHRIILEKLQITPGQHLLDIGCGWGSLLREASTSNGVIGHGIAASTAQVDYCTSLGLEDTHFQCGDYSQAPTREYDAVASVGMYDHVGASRSLDFFGNVASRLRPGGRYLNQAIIRRRPTPRRPRPRSFIDTYIFPGGQLLSLEDQIRDQESASLRVLGVETFGEDYVWTLGKWIDNLESNREECETLLGRERVRAWTAYLWGSLTRFERGDIDLAQVLSERPAARAQTRSTRDRA